MATMQNTAEQLPGNKGSVTRQNNIENRSTEESIATMHNTAKKVAKGESMATRHVEQQPPNEESIAAPSNPTEALPISEDMAADAMHNSVERVHFDQSMAITQNPAEKQLLKLTDDERTARTHDTARQPSKDASMATRHYAEERIFNKERLSTVQYRAEQLSGHESMASRHTAREKASSKQTSIQQPNTNDDPFQEVQPPAAQSEDGIEMPASSETISKYFLLDENQRPDDPSGPSAAIGKEPAATIDSALRKRKYSDTIDLTGHTDSNVDAMDVDGSGKGGGHAHPRPAALARRNYGGQPTPQRPSLTNPNNLPQPHPLPHQRTGHHIAKIPANNPPNTSPELFGFPGILSERLDIVRPLDSSRARTREEYNPETIARDVLRAIGHNLGGPALNGHLLGLKSRFRGVNNRSDLSTFRWDLVEASVGMPPAYSQPDANHGGQNMPVRGPARPSRGGPYSVAPAPSHHNFQRSYGTGGVSTYGGFLSSQPSYPPTSVPQNQTFQGAYRDPRAHGSQIQRLQSSAPPSTTSSQARPLATPPQYMVYNQNARPPGRPLPQPTSISSNDGLPRPGMATLGSVPSRFRNPLIQVQPYQTVPGPAPLLPETAHSDLLRSKAIPPQHTQPPRPATSTNGHQERASSSSSPGPSSTTTPRKGISRPPGSKNLPKTTPSSNLAVVITSGTPTPVTNRGRRFRNTPSIHSDPPAPTSLLQVPKKKGRPFRTPEAAAAAAKKAGVKVTGIVKKRGRPFGFKIKRQPDILVPEGVYHPFLCEWKGCVAELQNLETLRKHVKVVHRKRNEGGKLECRWGKCASEKEARDPETGKMRIEVKSVETDSKQDWKSHIEKHLLPVAWQMGDGPKGTVLSNKSKTTKDLAPSWLKDPYTNKLVTPWVKNQPIEGGRPKTNNAKRFRERREGIHVVLEPIKNPKAYMKIDYDEEEDESAEGGEESASDELASGMGTTDTLGRGIGMGMLRVEIRARGAEESEGARDEMEVDG